MLMTMLDAAAIFCNVPYKVHIDGAQLAQALLAGTASDSTSPHIDRLINEAPIEMLSGLLAEFSPDDRVKVIENMRKFALEYGAEKRIDAWMSCE